MKRALWLLLLGACEPRATTPDPTGAMGPGAAGAPGTPSAEYETCAATAACAPGLACIEATCRRTARSQIGDYQAALGGRLAARGDLTGAVAAYAAALAQYDVERVPLPPEVDCAYGATLADAAQHGPPDAAKKDGELAARVLHRCVLGVPAGSTLRARAFDGLATLAPLGLDPALVGGSKLADLYLTKAAARPATDQLAISVVATPVPTAKSFAPLPAALQGPAARGALVSCWESNRAATGADTLTVTVPVKAGFVESDYEGEGRFVAKLVPAAAGATVPPTETCVRGAVEQVLRTLKLTDGFDTKLAITIQ